MIQLKNSSQQSELRKSINRLVSNLDHSTHKRGDKLADTDESAASYISRLNDESLNRAFLDYCSAAKNYAKFKLDS
ncbi:MAG: hypothetical protein ABJG47_16610 [Ekhidna sp.]